jgi:hypothetical protein
MEKTFYTILILNSLFFCCNMAFTIGGSIILDQNKNVGNSDNTFFNVWLSNLILTVLSGISSIVILSTCCGLTQIDNEKKSDKNQLCDFIGLGISIWTLIIYFGDNIDMSLLESDHYSLYMLLKFRVFYSIGLFSIIGLLLFGMLLYCICGIICMCCFNQEKTTDDVLRSTLNHNVSFDDQSSEINLQV